MLSVVQFLRMLNIFLAPCGVRASQGVLYLNFTRKRSIAFIGIYAVNNGLIFYPASLIASRWAVKPPFYRALMALESMFGVWLSILGRPQKSIFTWRGSVFS